MHACFVLTSGYALNAFVAPTIRALMAQGWGVTVVINVRLSPIAPDIAASVEIIDLELARAIAPASDLHALWKLVRLFRARRFDIVHSVTPKAGLLAMMGACLARVPVRVHTFTGQIWATRQGPIRWLLRAMDQLLARCATVLLVDSPSQRDFLVAQHVVALSRLHVLGQGSIAGVDAARFAPQPGWRAQIRAELAVSEDALLLLYIGRMQRDKGLVELCQSFARLAAVVPRAHLLLVGPDEGALGEALAMAAPVRDRIHVVGLTSEPEKYMAAADIFCLASYREGFGLSLIEAAAAGLPCVACRIYGVTDAVVDGETGLLVPVRDADAFFCALLDLAERPDFRVQLGVAAKARAEKDFSQQMVVQAWLAFYQQQCASITSKKGMLRQ